MSCFLPNLLCPIYVAVQTAFNRGRRRSNGVQAAFKRRSTTAVGVQTPFNSGRRRSNVVLCLNAFCFGSAVASLSLSLTTCCIDRGLKPMCYICNRTISIRTALNKVYFSQADGRHICTVCRLSKARARKAVVEHTPQLSELPEIGLFSNTDRDSV